MTESPARQAREVAFAAAVQAMVGPRVVTPEKVADAILAALTAAGMPPTPVGQVVLEDGAWRVSAGNPEFVPRWAVLVPEPFDPKHPPHYLRPVGPTTAEEER